MASCAYCGSTIIFGGVDSNGRRYCKENCRQSDTFGQFVDAIPEDAAQAVAMEIRNGGCPECKSHSPVDHFTSYRCLSFLVLTRWNTRVHVCCSSCAKRKVMGDLALTTLLGWWGFPWGFILTPIQIVRNVGALFRGVELTPSKEMLQVARRAIAAQAVAREQQQQIEGA